MAKEILNVSVESIIPAPFNPVDRTTLRQLSKLKASIEEYGILQPLLITNNNELIDGHRRLECAKLLGITTVPCVITNVGRDVAFVEVNTTGKTISLSDDIEIYLSGGALPRRSRKEILTLESIYGKDGLSVFVDNKLSPRATLQAVAQVSTYLKEKNPTLEPVDKTRARKIIDWIIENKLKFRIRLAISMRINPKVLIDCIDNNKPIPLVYG